MAHSSFSYVKSFERKDTCLPQCFIVIRVDGRNFHNFCDSHKFIRPHDARCLKLMDHCALAVCNEFPDCSLAYGQSDEYSFLFLSNTQLFKRRKEKLITTVVSCFTANFVFNWKKFMSEQPDPLPWPNFPKTHISPFTEMNYLPQFDARIIEYPNLQAVQDYFSWRQVDTHVNCLYNTTNFAQIFLLNLTPGQSEQKLCKTLSSDKNEILFQLGINYNNVPARFRLGSLIYRDADTGKYTVHFEKFIQNPKFWDERPQLTNSFAAFKRILKKKKKKQKSSSSNSKDPLTSSTTSSLSTEESP